MRLRIVCMLFCFLPTITSCDLLFPDPMMSDIISDRIDLAFNVSIDRFGNTDTNISTNYSVYFTGDTLFFSANYEENFKIESLKIFIEGNLTDGSPPISLYQKSFKEFKGKKTFEVEDFVVLPSTLEYYSDEGTIQFQFSAYLKLEEYSNDSKGKGVVFWVLPCEEYPDHCTNESEE